jgi:hypothetical protein
VSQQQQQQQQQQAAHASTPQQAASSVVQDANMQRTVCTQHTISVPYEHRCKNIDTACHAACSSSGTSNGYVQPSPVPDPSAVCPVPVPATTHTSPPSLHSLIL